MWRMHYISPISVKASEQHLWSEYLKCKRLVVRREIREEAPWRCGCSLEVINANIGQESRNLDCFSTWLDPALYWLWLVSIHRTWGILENSSLVQVASSPKIDQTETPGKYNGVVSQVKKGRDDTWHYRLDYLARHSPDQEVVWTCIATKVVPEEVLSQRQIPH